MASYSKLLTGFTAKKPSGPPKGAGAVNGGSPWLGTPTDVPGPEKGQAPLTGPGAQPAGTSPPAGPPVDPIYDNQVAGITRGRDDTLLDLQHGETRTLSDYGYSATRDPTSGVYSDFKVDPANPFSRAALLQRSYQQGKQGNTTSYAARGQLYSGALQRAQSETDRGYLQGQNQLVSSLGDLLSGFASQERNTRSNAEQALGGAEADRYDRARNDPGYVPVVDPPALSEADRAKVAQGKLTGAQIKNLNRVSAAVKNYGRP